MPLRNRFNLLLIAYPPPHLHCFHQLVEAGRIHLRSVVLITFPTFLKNLFHPLLQIVNRLLLAKKVTQLVIEFPGPLHWVVRDIKQSGFDLLH